MLSIVINKLRHNRLAPAWFFLLYSLGLIIIMMFLGADLGLKFDNAANSHLIYTSWAGSVVETHKLAELLQYTLSITALFFYYLLVSFFYSCSASSRMFTYLKSRPRSMLAYLLFSITINFCLAIFFKIPAIFIVLGLLWAASFVLMLGAHQ